MNSEEDSGFKPASATKRPRPSFCPECKSGGNCSKLRLSCLSLSTGIWLCRNPKCCFPLNSPKIKDYIVNVDFLAKIKAKTSRKTILKPCSEKSSVKVKKTHSCRKRLQTDASSTSSSYSLVENKVTDGLFMEQTRPGAESFSNPEKKRRQNSHLEERHDCNPVNQDLNEGRNSRLDCMTVVSGASSSTLSDGISSRASPVDHQKPIYLKSWLNKIDCGGINHSCYAIEDEVENVTENISTLRKYSPFIPKREKQKQLEEKIRNGEKEPSFAIIESKSVDESSLFEGTWVSDCISTDESDSAYSSPMTDLHPSKNHSFLPSEPSPASQIGNSLSDNLMSALDMVDDLFIEGENFSKITDDDGTLLEDQNCNIFDFRIDTKNLL